MMAKQIQHGMVVDGHLGGYVPGGDPATFYPALWDWLVKDLGVRSVIDVGCGDGVAVNFFQSQGCIVLGIDGIEQDHPNIVTHDYTTGRYEGVPTDVRFDLAWSCEFVEHVDARHVPNFLDTFAHADRVLMTHAMPGQAGWHHVNCQPADYWVEMLAFAGFRLDEAVTEISRQKAAINPNPYNHYARSGLAFKRSDD